jgi:hypothetical protein
MTITKVTSLADLEFKAKTDRHYQQLAILGCKSFNCNIKTYPAAIRRLHEIAFENNPECCSTVINCVNQNCNKIKPEKDPVSVLVKKKEVERIIANLKKLSKAPITKKATKKIKRRVARTV